MISTVVYIDKYRYVALAFVQRTQPLPRSHDVNSDTSLAAWMIAGGPRTIDPSDARNRAHGRELAAVRGSREGTPFTVRIGAALSAFRSPQRVGSHA